MRSALDRARFLSYDTETYDFAGLVAREVFKVPDLARLHEYYWAHKQMKGLERQLTYHDNLTLRGMLDALPLDGPFHALYNRFVREVLAPKFGGSISYSRRPTFRVQMAQTPSISNWHTDEEVTHRSEQINAWLPFVNTFASNSIWVESHYGRADFAPVDVMYGEVFLFDGGHLLHGSVPNVTSSTRVSMDFRFNARRSDLRFPDLGILSARPRDKRPEC